MLFLIGFNWEMKRHPSCPAVGLSDVRERLGSSVWFLGESGHVTRQMPKTCTEFIFFSIFHVVVQILKTPHRLPFAWECIVCVWMKCI